MRIFKIIKKIPKVLIASLFLLLINASAQATAESDVLQAGKTVGIAKFEKENENTADKDEVKKKDLSEKQQLSYTAPMSGLRASDNEKVRGAAFPVGVGPGKGERGILFYLSFEHSFKKKSD